MHVLKSYQYRGGLEAHGTLWKATQSLQVLEEFSASTQLSHQKQPSRGLESLLKVDDERVIQNDQ